MVTLDAELRMVRSPTSPLLRAHPTPLHVGKRIVSAMVIVDDGFNDIARASVSMLRTGS